AVVETGGTAVITVTRAVGDVGAVSATFSTDGGTALPGVDFVPVTQTVTFADGDLAPKFIFIPILDDGLMNEPNATLGLTLSNPAGGATLGTPSTATLTIIELPEPPPTVQLFGTTLIVTGTPDNDVIFFLPGARKGQVLVFANGQFRGLFVPKLIFAFGLGGNDFISSSRRIKVGVFFDGGPGHDILVGGGAFSCRVGGPGTNLLVPGSGRNTLIGGGPGSGVVIFGTPGPDFIEVARRATPQPTLLVNFNGQQFAYPYLQGTTVTVFGRGGDD